MWSRRVAVALLLIAVAGLSTLAKNSLYYQNSGIHYISIASKMKVAHVQIKIDRTPVRPTIQFVAPLPSKPVFRIEDVELPSIQRTDPVIRLQHRPPPPVAQS